VKSLFVTLALAGALGATGVASAGTDTTTPAGTEPAGTEPTGTEAGPDLAGTTVTVFGVETTTEGPAFQVALNEFADANGMTVTYTGSRGFEGELGTMVEGGSPPDIAVIPQPGRIAGYAASGDALPLPEDVAATAAANMDDSVLAKYMIDDALYALPFKADLKSLVWYLPAVFAEKGYEVPTTWDEFLALTEAMIANGDTPLCVGIGSQDATGWPFTDWTEEIVLREQGLDFYNQWVAHEVPFNSPRSSRPCSRSSTSGTPRAWCTPRAATSPAPTSATTPYRWSRATA
jgi:alpha-glucoside transport system substrate-binding protein